MSRNTERTRARSPTRPSSPSNTPNDPSALAGSSGEAQSSSALPLPHERDQAVGDVQRPPDPVIEQARRDLQQGQVDTDMRATPGLDAERRKRIVDTPPPQRAVGNRPQTGTPAADRQRGSRRPK